MRLEFFVVTGIKRLITEITNTNKVSWNEGYILTSVEYGPTLNSISLHCKVFLYNSPTVEVSH